ncbi:MAG: hypothetical protein QXK12_05270 [Candidatus Nezhaarchaeales archaeon]
MNLEDFNALKRAILLHAEAVKADAVIDVVSNDAHHFVFMRRW